MNNLQTIRKQAEMLMTHHGVGRIRFDFDRGTRRIACVKYNIMTVNNKQIKLVTALTMSKRWAMVLPDSDIWEVMIHEIAHIHTIDAKRPHGVEFKNTVRALGGRATGVCFSPSVNIDGTPRSK